MSLPDPVYVVCRNGVFGLPEAIYQTLAALVPRGMVYLREDEDVLTISTYKLAGGRRRQLNGHYRAAMFRTATQLAIIDLKESLRIMAVGWRAPRARGWSPPRAP